MKRIRAAIVVLFTAAWAATAAAQEAPASSIASRSGYFSLGFGAGLMIDPDMGAGMVSLDYYVTDEISVGPYFQVGGGPDDSYWGVSGQVKFSAALSSNSSVRPYGRLGIGFVELDFDDRKDDPEMTYLFPVGGGLEFELTDLLSLDVGGVFNITEDSFAGLLAGIRLLL